MPLHNFLKKSKRKYPLSQQIHTYYSHFLNKFESSHYFIRHKYWRDVLNINLLERNYLLVYYFEPIYNNKTHICMYEIPSLSKKNKIKSSVIIFSHQKFICPSFYPLQLLFYIYLHVFALKFTLNLFSSPSLIFLKFLLVTLCLNFFTLITLPIWIFSFMSLSLSTQPTKDKARKEVEILMWTYV